MLKLYKKCCFLFIFMFIKYIKCKINVIKFLGKLIKQI